MSTDAPSSGLRKTKCLNHEGREAVARCPACGNFFCRECITEHDHRVICASCLKKLLADAPSENPRRMGLGGRTIKAGAKCLFGLVVAWLFFYAIGQVLLMIPDSFHSGKLWEMN